jgi:TonB family protein
MREYHSDRDLRRSRVFAIAMSIFLHGALCIGLLFFRDTLARISPIEEIFWGSSGGGGGEGATDDAIQFGPQGASEQDPAANQYGHQFTLLQIHVYDDRVVANPIPVKEEPKPTSTIKKKKKAAQPIIADNLPTRWIRRGTGPGSGGGAGGGSGGGIGKGQGFSIDWGGNGSRRLLSGRIPKYPEGTDKQMAVTLRFSVLPDGSVDAILPTRKTDEILERAAISALHTWRFDPLPPEIAQETQVGKVTFNFKLE